MNIFQKLETYSEEEPQYTLEELTEATSILELVDEISDTVDKKGINISMMATLESIEPTLPEEVPITTFTKEPSLINIAHAKNSIKVIRDIYNGKLGNK